MELLCNINNNDSSDNIDHDDNKLLLKFNAQWVFYELSAYLQFSFCFFLQDFLVLGLRMFNAFFSNFLCVPELLYKMKENLVNVKYAMVLPCKKFRLHFMNELEQKLVPCHPLEHFRKCIDVEILLMLLVTMLQLQLHPETVLIRLRFR